MYIYIYIFFIFLFLIFFKLYFSDFKITGFGYFRTLEEELVVLMKKIGSCKHGYLIFQNV
jgi:hypothetical protein